MRVISGTARGKKLIAPKGNEVRPTADRVKEALFNIISAHVEEACVLDLFCGTGALGVEALSRGARRAVFVDNSMASIETTRRNVNEARVEAAANIQHTNVLAFLRSCKAEGDNAFDLVFLDPPYKFDEAKLDEILALIATAKCIYRDAIIVLERSSKVDPRPVKGLQISDNRRYGDTTLTFYSREEEAF